MNATGPDKAIAEEVSGLIERVTFHNEENGFCVLRVRVRGHRDEMTVLGSLPSVTAGEWLEARGLVGSETKSTGSSSRPD